MPGNPCLECDHDVMAPDGLCTQVAGSDKGIVRCVGGWSVDKHHYLNRYIDIFTTSMRKKWRLCYLDFFAGPGSCRVRETGEEIEASPLIALNTKFPFNNYYFIDENHKACEVLRERMQKYCISKDIEPDIVTVMQGDCNSLVERIRESIPTESLSLCFLDPTGLQLKFDTLKILTAAPYRIDLIINFPLGTAIKRNIEQFYQRGSLLMNQFWGDDSWQEIYRKLPSGASDGRFVSAFIQGYRDKLIPLGYQDVKLGSEIGIRHYYYLIFASKNPLGQKFWREIIKSDPHGQQKLKL